MPKKVYQTIQKRQLQLLVEHGWTEQEIAEFYGVAAWTITRWKTRHPDFKANMKLWKQTADAKVERSVYESALGFTAPEERIFIGENDRVIRVKSTKFYPPNPTMAIFWLTNRQHGDWKRTRQETGSDPLSIKIMQMVNGNGNGKHENGEEPKQDVSSAVTIQRGMKIVE